MLWIVALMAGYGPYDAAASDRSRALQARESEIVCTITFDMQDEFVVFAPGSAELSAAESTCLALWIDHWGARNQDGRYRGISIVARGVWIAADRVDLTLTKRRAAAVGAVLVEHGVPTELIHANALGPLDPYSKSTSVESSARQDYAEIFLW